MANTEIDENQLAGLRDLQGFVQKAMSHPEHRRTLLKVQKELYPDIAVPELDAANPVLEEVRKMREDFEADRKAREEADAKRAEDSAKGEWEQKWLQGRKALKEKNYNEEGIEAIEKLMLERNIPDHEAGLALFERQNPPPPPSLSGGSRRFGWFDENNEKNPDIQRLFNKDYDGFLADAIDSARRDFKQGQDR